MRNIGAHDLHADIGYAHHIANVRSDALGNCHDMLVGGVVEVPNELYLSFWDNERVARLDGVDIEKRESIVVFVYFVTGDFAVDNTCENRWFLHSPSIYDVISTLSVRVRSDTIRVTVAL